MPVLTKAAKKAALDEATALADELGEVMALRKELEKKEAEIKDKFKTFHSDFEIDSVRGDTFSVHVVTRHRSTLDRKALEAALGEEAIAPFMVETSYLQVETSKL